jgi:hypothetical protein
MTIMDIKDLAGLSKPLTRLVEVISQGIGAVSHPYLIRKNADAKAYAIKTISGALAEVAKQHRLPVVFKEEGVEIWQRPEDRTLKLENVSAEERADARLEYQERKRQRNLESITSLAAAELASESIVSETPPDEDWISRFFSAAQEVSSEQMQELWGRILAGEIKQPGSFSLRTLDFVRNLTKSDAVVLEKLANLALKQGDTSFIPVFDNEWLQVQRKIFPMNHFALSELGAMYPTDLTFRLFVDGDPVESYFVSGKYILLVNKGSLVGELQTPIWKFTNVGREVIHLISPDGDIEFIRKVGQYYAANRVSVQLATISDVLPTGHISFTNAEVIPAPGVQG